MSGIMDTYSLYRTISRYYVTKGNSMKKTKRSNFQSKRIIRIAGITGLILMVPLVATLVTDQVNWGVGDFVIMGALIFVTGILIDWAIRKAPEKYRIALVALALIAFLFIWGQLAVGMFD